MYSTGIKAVVERKSPITPFTHCVLAVDKQARKRPRFAEAPNSNAFPTAYSLERSNTGRAVIRLAKISERLARCRYSSKVVEGSRRLSADDLGGTGQRFAHLRLVNKRYSEGFSAWYMRHRVSQAMHVSA